MSHPKVADRSNKIHWLVGASPGVGVSVETEDRGLQLHRSIHGNILQHHFEIEGSVFICAPLDNSFFLQLIN